MRFREEPAVSQETGSGEISSPRLHSVNCCKHIFFKRQLPKLGSQLSTKGRVLLLPILEHVMVGWITIDSWCVALSVAMARMTLLDITSNSGGWRQKLFTSQWSKNAKSMACDIW